MKIIFGRCGRWWTNVRNTLRGGEKRSIYSTLEFKTINFIQKTCTNLDTKIQRKSMGETGEWDDEGK